MLALWLTAFIGGVVLGRAGAPAAPVLFAAGLVAAVVWRRRLDRGRLTRFFVAALGVWWGSSHAAPQACTRHADAEVVQRNGPFPGGGPLLIAASGARYEAYGDQERAVRGRIATIASRRVFAPCFAFFRATVARDPPRPSPVVVAARELRQHVLAATASFPWETRAFLRSVVVGDKSRLPRPLIAAFRDTGLYHLLVVSGQHVTLVSILLAGAVKAPLQLAYALRLIDPRIWRHLAAALGLVVALMALVYAAATGMSAASQRAALLFVVWQVTRVFFGSLPVARRLLLAAVAQAAVFPIGFVSEASLMSWCAYMIVLRDAPGLAKAALGERVLRAFVMQARLMAVTAAAFGQLSLLGLVANGIFVSLFSFVLALSVLLVAAPAAPWVPLILGAQQSFLGMLTGFGGLSERFPWLAPPPEALLPWHRLAFCLIAAVVILNTCRALTIRPYENN